MLTVHITNETAHYPVPFGTGPKFSLHMHHFYLNIAKKYMSLILLYNLPAGQAISLDF